MNRDKFVFAQFADFLDHNKFRRLVNKYNALCIFDGLVGGGESRLGGKHDLKDIPQHRRRGFDV